MDQRRWEDLKSRLKIAQPLHLPPRPGTDTTFTKITQTENSLKDHCSDNHHVSPRVLIDRVALMAVHKQAAPVKRILNEDLVWMIIHGIQVMAASNKT